MATTTWNPADNVGFTLSGGNLTATATNTAGGSRSIASVTSGKYYWEYTCTFWAGFGILIGVANGSANLSTLSGTMVGACAITGASGTIYVNNVTGVATLGGRANNDVIGIAVDRTNSLIWFRVAPSGNWNGSGTANPATGVGGISIGPIISGGLYGLVDVNPGLGGLNITANFGATAFVGAVPSGFTPGLSPASPPVDFAGNLGGVSSYGKLSYGLKKYSRVAAFAPAFAANFSVSPEVALSGDLAPAVSLAANLGVVGGLSGDLAPAISFSADTLDVTGFVNFSGNLVPQIALGGSLSLDLPLTALEGGLTPIVALAASSFVSGPLWVAEAPVAPPWVTSEPCPPSMWTPIGPCEPVAWDKSELCNG